MTASVSDEALGLDGASLNYCLDDAGCVGGYELAAILGSVLAARHHRIPVLLDGFVCTAAVLPLIKLTASALDHTQLSHCSAEAGHRKLADALRLKRILDLGLRLGAGSGSAVAIPVLRAALACHNGMATFAEAAVSQSDVSIQ